MFRYRIKFVISSAAHLGLDSSEFEFSLPSGSFILKSASEGKRINESTELIITSKGYDSEEAALAEGNRIMDLLRWCSAKFHIGINLGNRKKTGGLTNFVIDKIYRETGVTVINGVHGLMVYEDTGNTKIAYSSASAVLIKGKESIENEFREFLQKKIIIPDQLRLAFEFFSIAKQSGMPPRVSFLIYIITIESLLEQKERRKSAAKHVDHMIELTKGNNELTEDERISIVKSLTFLRNDSISSSGKQLVGRLLNERQYGNKSVKKFFRDCYSIRSDFVHYGKWDDQNDYLLGELERMVSDLLIALVETQISGSERQTN